MFRSLKLYKDQAIDLKELLVGLIDFGYKRQDSVTDEGEFSHRGNIIDIFPVTFEYPIRLELDDRVISSIKSFGISDGKSLWEHNMAILLPLRRRVSHSAGLSDELPISNFADFEKGDYVVHIKHGIGIYRGIQRTQTQGGIKDQLLIEYAKSDKLYVPVEQMYLLQKYIGIRARPPRVNRLGSKEWQAIKDRTRRGIHSLALQLLENQASRQTKKGFKYGPDNDWQEEFEKSFPYKETPDQAKAVLDVKRDMEEGRIMDRLLCGDVGYGKTEVAMRAAFKAVMNNKQVAILVPTTILAEQHYQNFLERVKEYPFNIQMLSRFRSKLEQKQIIKNLKDGSVDIVIGTHALLSDEVKFKDLGLLIVDEEQRFGVMAKEKLKSLKDNVCVLTLTATPIPRTLYMSLMSIKDMSVINTPPKNRMSVDTHFAEFDIDLIRQVAVKELNRNGQVFIVHNHVADIEDLKEDIIEALPKSTSIALAHGQMHSDELEAIMGEFLKGSISVLIATNIIESGIDVPRANTIIVNNAHDFGLADLHQLRGRVGRFDRKAYAYFLVPKGLVLNANSRKRLEAIQKYSQLGSGFKIAVEDLEIRGAGNLLGTQQHGFIIAVGFDLYCRMLRDVVLNLSLLKSGSFN